MPFTLIDFGVWCDAGIDFGVWCDAGDPMSLLPIETANGPDSVYGTVKPFLASTLPPPSYFRFRKDVALFWVLLSFPRFSMSLTEPISYSFSDPSFKHRHLFRQFLC